MPASRITMRTRRRARALRSAPTDAEKALWRALDPLRRAGLHIRRQAPIGPYVADFAIHALRLVIEVDGGQHADSRSDHRRDAWLAREGYRVLRLWNTDVLANPEGCLTVIGHAIAEQQRRFAADGEPDD